MDIKKADEIVKKMIGNNGFNELQRSFKDKAKIPDDTTLKQTLGKCYSYYLELRNTAHLFDSKWSYYKGWSEKFFSKKKALFYFIPYEDGYKLRLTIRESERPILLGIKKTRICIRK